MVDYFPLTLVFVTSIQNNRKAVGKDTWSHFFIHSSVFTATQYFSLVCSPNL